MHIPQPGQQYKHGKNFPQYKGSIITIKEVTSSREEAEKILGHGVINSPSGYVIFKEQNHDMLDWAQLDTFNNCDWYEPYCLEKVSRINQIEIG